MQYENTLSFPFLYFLEKMYANCMQIIETMYAHQRTLLDKRRPKKDGLYPVKVRVTFESTTEILTR
jgi:hypothetical protein